MPVQRDLVTGEAVELTLQPASFAVRTVAYAVDFLLMTILLGGGSFLAVTVLTDGGVNDAVIAAVSVTWTVTVLVVFPVAVELASRGRSLGKLIMGTRVVRDDGGPVRMRQSLLRAVAAVGEIWLTSGAVALFTSLVHRRSKRVGDLLAGTFVLQERSPRRRSAPVPMPPELTEWVRASAVSRLPGPLAEAGRSFVHRAATLNPASRRELGWDLTRQFLRHVSPPPPAGTSPELFLAAVIARRREIDHDALQRRREAATHRAAELHALPFVG